jgi:sulfite reductase beta subunit-like hemoprotein
LTTRQDIEIHDITAEQAIEIQGRLEEAGLSTLGAGGDSLRNITICPCSGVVSGSVDLYEFALSIRDELESIEEIYRLPRKFKISFSCSMEGHAQPWINDLGFSAAYREEQFGFQVVAGGSLGARPGTGMVIFDWLSVYEILPFIVGTLRVFYENGDRENRSRARLRHVRERLGDELFKEMLVESFERSDREKCRPIIEPTKIEDGFDDQIVLTFPNGDITADMAEAFGDIAGNTDVRVRIANDHRIIVFGRNEAGRIALEKYSGLFKRAKKPQASVVACPGKRWCHRAKYVKSWQQVCRCI